MRLRQLEAFKQVMLTGSVTRAAEVLRISQPGVSRLLAELERNLGFRLFARRGGRVYATPEAVSFLRHVERSFVGIESLRQAAADIAGAKGASLRLAAFPAISLAIMPAALSEFNRSHPDTRVSLTVTNSPRVAEQVSMLQVDLGVTTLPVATAGLVIEFELSLACVCALPLKHRLTKARRVRAQDLQREALVSLDAGFATARRTREILEGAGAGSRVVAETSFSYSACEMVRQGAGVAIVDPITALAFSGRGVLFREFVPRVDFVIALIKPAHQEVSLTSCRMIEIVLPTFQSLSGRIEDMLHPRG